MEILQIPVEKIQVANRLRAVNEDKVRQIALSMVETVRGRPRGQMVPIEVGPEDYDGFYPLISGAHRFEAIKLAGEATANAIVFDGSTDPDELRIREIDENLYRNDLSPYDFATFIGERARLFEKLNGKIKQGGSRKVQVAPLLFTKQTAAALGFSEDTVKRARARIKGIAPDVWEQLRGTAVAENGSYLDALTRLTANEQREVVKTMRGSGFQYALGLVQGKPAKKPLSPKAESDKLWTLWEMSSAAGQELFRRRIRRKHGAGSSGEG